MVSQSELNDVAGIAAQEILEGYRSFDGQHWDGNSPVRHQYYAPSLEGVPYSVELTHAVSHEETVRLRKGHGIIAVIFSQAGICTGEVAAQPASDDFDI